MNTDALHRRLRFAAPSPRVKRIVLTEPDYQVFQLIDRHGPLPSHYLYEYTKGLRRNQIAFQKRLTEFYNGDALGPYLERPQQQFAAFNAHCQHVVYDLAPRARLALSERGLLSRVSPRRTDPFLHKLMSACVGASIELSARSVGARYISREQIFLHPSCPQATRDASNPMALPLPGLDRRTLIPDDLFGLRYRGADGQKLYRFFAVEIDRNTESIERKNLDTNTFGHKIGAYLTVLRSGLYRSYWGLPNLHVLTVTTNATHALNIMDFVRRQKDAQFEDRFGFQVDTDFGANWRVPKGLLTPLLTEPWTTPNGSKDIAKP